MTITFAVSDVQPQARPLKVLDPATALGVVLQGQRCEGFGVGSWPLVACTDVNPLVEAALLAFDRHFPLLLTPDAVWLTLAQGFARHVNLHAEALRERFVRHEGKLKLVVRRDDFLLGQPNPWPEAFAGFSEQIAAHLGKLRDLVVADFSTTDVLARAASEVTLMDAFQPYFEYEMMCGCGIPSITLTGTPDDWRSVRRRAAVLGEYGLEGWARALAPILDQFVRAAEGNVDRSFWESLYRYRSGSGGTTATGWLCVLFPYLAKPRADSPGPMKQTGNASIELVPNPYLDTWSSMVALWDDEKRPWWEPLGPLPSELPSGLASAPVLASQGGVEFPLRFIGGLFGVGQDPVTHTVAPQIGWAVVHEERGRG